MCFEINKRYRIIIEDLGALQKSRAKVGIILESNANFVKIKTDNRVEVLPVARIIRCEEL